MDNVTQEMWAIYGISLLVVAVVIWMVSNGGKKAAVKSAVEAVEKAGGKVTVTAPAPAAE